MDPKLLFGIGLGLLLSIALSLPFKMDSNIAADTIEERAREMGMKYPDEIKAIEKGD
ncbi:MAG: hypothetical protein ACI33K_11515 [Clostridiaceae bacterium]